MRNIWRIFRADWQRISASVVAVVVIMGLCLIPCLYAWFNIFSNWDPYGPASTSQIKILNHNAKSFFHAPGKFTKIPGCNCISIWR